MNFKRTPIFIGLTSLFLMSVSASAVDCPTGWEPEICQLKDVVDTIKKEHKGDVDISKLLNAGIKKTVTELPNANYLDKDGYKTMWENIRSGNTVGIGVTMEASNDWFVFTTVHPDTPAERAGAKDGDTLLAVDDVYVRGLPYEKVAEKIKGKDNTPVKLKVDRKVGDHYEFVELNVIRGAMKNSPLIVKRLQNDYVWARIPGFVDRTAVELKDALNAEIAKSVPKGIILDLRYNGGGRLEAAVGVSALFLPADSVVTHVRGKNESKTYRTRFEFYKTALNEQEDFLKDQSPALKKIPLVVLINEGSASGAEMVAGAMQDHGRAVLMGKNSFGKGSAQTTSQQMGESGLTITTAYYETPSGCAVNLRGIRPNIVVDNMPDGDIDASLINRAIDRVPSAVELSPIDPEIAAERAARSKRKTELLLEYRHKGKTVPTFPTSKHIGLEGDFILDQALNFLHGRPVYQKQGVLATRVSHKNCGSIH